MAEVQAEDDWDQSGAGGEGGEGDEEPDPQTEHDADVAAQAAAGEAHDLDEDDDLFGESAPEPERADDSLLMRFCPHDSSMLYPQEHRRTRTLRYACRLCRYSEENTGSGLIYRNTIKKEVGNLLATVPGAVSDDPSLPRSQNASCANCGHNEAVFFQSDSTSFDTLALVFVCCNCEHKWVA